MIRYTLMKGATVQVRRPGGDWVAYKLTRHVPIPPQDFRIDPGVPGLNVATVDGWDIAFTMHSAMRSRSRLKDAAPGECPKCGGKGRVFGCDHVEQGRCFRCGGTGNTKIPPMF